jgi:hypothetical protein
MNKVGFSDGAISSITVRLSAGYHEIELTEKNFYIYLDNSLKVYDNSWALNSLPTLITSVKYQSTVWYVKSDGIYSFAQNDSDTFLTKRSSNGIQLMWNESIPVCDGTSTPLVASCSIFTYVVCSTLNIVIQLNNIYGKEIHRYQIGDGKILAVECSSESFFILYDDSRVVQYSSNWYYVYTYAVSNRNVLPGYNQLKVVKGYLWYALCLYVFEIDLCEESAIYQWKISPETPAWKIEFSENRSQNGSIEIEMVERFSDFTVDAVIRKVQSNTEYLFQTSFVSSVSYMSGRITLVVAYFVGFNKAHKGTIGMLHQLTTMSNTTMRNSFETFSLKKMHIESNEVVFPTSRYASCVLKYLDDNFLLIHGGLSSDLQRTLSEFFAIDLLNLKFSRIPQSNSISR